MSATQAKSSEPAFSTYGEHIAEGMRGTLVMFKRPSESELAMLVLPYTYCPNVADILDESNWATIQATLAKANPTGEDYQVASFGHWATAYDLMLVRAGSAAHTAAVALMANHSEYPILDEGDLSERESEAAYESVRDSIRALTFECLGSEIDYNDVASDMYDWFANNGNWGFLEDPSNRSVRDEERDEALEALGWTLHEDDVYRRLA